jgi:methionyl-tRNA formyltransferase
MSIREIIFAGNGHGGVAALESLKIVCEKIFLITDDQKLVELLRPQDKRINDFIDSDVKLVVCAAYSKIIKNDILSSKIIINTHPSLLPKYRGIHSLAWAMLNLEPIVGFSIHLMNENIDDGPILEQYKVDVGDKTSKEIMDLFDVYVFENLGNVVNKFKNGEIEPKHQSLKDASWCCKRNLDDCVLNYNASHDELKAMFKVLVPPYPRPILKLGDDYYNVYESEVIKDAMTMHLGRVVNLQDGSVYIKFKESILKIKKIKKINSDKACDVNEIFKFGMRLI